MTVAPGHWHGPIDRPDETQPPEEVQTYCTSLPHAWNMPPHPSQAEPQSMPAGSRLQLRDVGLGAPATHMPDAVQVLLVTVPVSVPVSEQG
jgi:hypothetical protein